MRVVASGADVLLCTHTGIPWQGNVAGTLVVNVGTVGRPANDGRTETWYAVLDLDAGEARAQLVPVTYEWRTQAASMRGAGLPEAFVETIETGWWTTCLEVVPPRERARGRFSSTARRCRPSLATTGSGGLTYPRCPTEAGRSWSCSAPRRSVRGFGSTRTSTATWRATTAWSPPPRARAVGRSASNASSSSSTRPSPRVFARPYRVTATSTR